MSIRRTNTQFDQSELLIDMPERNQGLDWPLAVDLWLDQRVQQARDAGMTTTRKELSAALMTWLEPTDDLVVDILRRYRRRSGRDLLGAPADAPNVIAFEPRTSGPTRRANYPTSPA
jgi:hypothetical protein